MISTVFITVLAFNSWDTCQDWVARNNMHDADLVCEQVEVETEEVTAAPKTSLRPVARPSK